MAIRLVAVDVDGTLVTADQRVLPRVQAAAQRALEHGIQLVLCTGRAPGECWYILDALPQIRYAVTQTGAIAQDLKTGETLYHCPLSPDDARLIYSHVRRYDGLVNFFSGGIVYNSKEQMARFERYYPADFRWLFEQSHEFVDDLDAMVAGWGKPVEKLYVPFSSQEECERAMADLTKLPYFVTGAGYVDLEVMNPNTSKGIALAALCKKLGVPREQVMADRRQRQRRGHARLRGRRRCNGKRGRSAQAESRSDCADERRRRRGRYAGACNQRRDIKWAYRI